jgi:hypothetical protein
MKDKLVRYNHKAGYYVMKKFAIGASVLVASSILIALPISFGLNMVKSSEVAKTEVNPSSASDVETLKY